MTHIIHQHVLHETLAYALVDITFSMCSFYVPAISFFDGTQLVMLSQQRQQQKHTHTHIKTHLNT